MRKPTDTDKFIELRTSGKTFEDISKEMNISKRTAIQWSKDLSMELQNIANLRRESLVKRFELTEEDKIRRLGSIVSKIDLELETRDLKTLSTKELIEISLKLSSSIQSTWSNLVLKEKVSMIDRDLRVDVEWKA